MRAPERRVLDAAPCDGPLTPPQRLVRGAAILFILTLLPLSLGIVSGAEAQAKRRPRVSATPSDLLTIVGRVGSETGFAKRIRLQARGGPIKDFLFLVSDLEAEATEEETGLPPEQIDRTNVELVGERSLTPGVPRDFQVVVTGVPRPGTYVGEMEFLVVTGSRSTKTTVPLKVVASAIPSLTPLPGSNPLEIHLAYCSGWGPIRWLDCTFAGLFLPDSAFINALEEQLSNEVLAEVKIDDVQFSLIGSRTGYRLTNNELEPDATPKAMPAGRIVNYHVVIHRSLIPADEYAGTMYLKLADKDEQLAIPVSITMREGAFLALVALIIGVLLGRRVLRPAGDRPAPEAPAAVARLEEEVAGLPKEDQQAMKPLVSAAKRHVDRGEGAAALAMVERGRTGVEVVQALTAADELVPKTDSIRADASNLIASAKDAMMSGEPDKAAAQTEKLYELLEADTMQGARKHAAVARTGSQMLANTGEREPKTIERAVKVATGVPQQATRNSTVARGVLYLALVTGLILAGIQSEYVDKGVSFGAAFGDFLALVAWGLTADVASRTLTSLRGNPA